MTDSIALFRNQPADMQVHRHPFPHVVVDNPVSRQLADDVRGLFPDWRDLSGGDTEPNKAHRLNASQSLQGGPSLLTQFVEYHTSQKWVQDVARLFPELDWMTDQNSGVRFTGDHELSLDCQFVINTPSEGGTTVRDPHVDNPREVFAGLWYFRDEDDDSEGGDLVLYDCDEVEYHRSKWGKGSVDTSFLRPSKVVELQNNRLVLFVNGPFSVHGVTPRGPSEHPRRYVNLIGEVKNPLFSLKGRHRKV